MLWSSYVLQHLTNVFPWLLECNKPTQVQLASHAAAPHHENFNLIRKATGKVYLADLGNREVIDGRPALLLTSLR